MLRFVLITTILTCTAGGISLRRGEHGNFEFTVNRATGAGNEMISIQLDLSTQNIIPGVVVQAARNHPENILLRLNDGSDDFTSQPIDLPREFFQSRTRPIRGSSRPWKFGIGPHSPLVEFLGPVTILLSPDEYMDAQLLLNTSIDSFRAACFNGSSLTFPLSAFGENTTNEVIFELRMPTGEESYFAVFVSEDNRRFRINVDPLGPETVLAAPDDIVRFVREILLEEDALEGDDQIFENCEQDILSHLPDIVLNLSFSTLGLSSQIVLTPPDYMFIYPDLRSCRIGLAIINPDNNEAILDLLQLTGVNLHISQSGIEMCEPV